MIVSDASGPCVPKEPHGSAEFKTEMLGRPIDLLKTHARGGIMDAHIVQMDHTDYEPSYRKHDMLSCHNNV